MIPESLDGISGESASLAAPPHLILFQINKLNDPFYKDKPQGRELKYSARKGWGWDLKPAVCLQAGVLPVTETDDGAKPFSRG